MKKLLLTLSTTMLIFGLAACGGKKSGSTSTSSASGNTSNTSQTSQTSSQAGASSSSEYVPTDTIYCKMEYSWWTADGAAIAIYMWNDGDEKPAAWPGQRMSAVAGHDHVWSFEANSTLRTTYPHLIFARVNASGDLADWGAKTVTLAWPTGNEDLFTISNSEASWGDPGCEGAWSSFGA